MPKKQIPFPIYKEETGQGKIERRPITEEMRTSYLDYAMSVIVSRALPDARDGLKPVHRRILYSMWQSGLRASAKFKKCATVVGDVLGKYHPHGDSAVYDSLVRMAQDFSFRYPLVRGQGNFGSLDGDSAAAYRYCVTADTRIVTERGLEKIGELSDREDVDLRILSKDRQIHRASKWFDSGTHPTLRITTNKGYSLTGSRNHPVLVWTNNGYGTPGFTWKLLEQIHLGDTLALDRSQELWPMEKLDLCSYYPEIANKKTQIKILPQKLNEDLAFIFGSLLSEGTLGKDKLEFCNSDAEWINEFERRWQRVFPDCRLHKFDRQPSSYGKKPYQRLEIHSHHVIEFLRNLGLDPKKSPERRVPEALYRATKPVMAAFLRAFFEGDGCVTFTDRMVQLGCVSTSEKLIKDLQVILLRFGIDAFKRFDRNRGTYTLHTRGVENYRLFHAEIGFVSARKQERLEEVLRKFSVFSSKTDFVPQLAQSIRQLVGAGSRFIHRHNFDRYPAMASNYEEVSTAVLEATDLDYNGYFEHLLTNHYLFEPVVEIMDAGFQPVYSIKVESDCHSFVGNGFINHNTEAKLAAIAEEMLFDIEKDTVDFVPNYDGSHKEPTVLPAKLPNLLLNGTLGIAVGMATNIPPHNLTELCEAVAALIENPEITVEELMAHVTGPDFPTGGIIYNQRDILQAYATGKSGIVTRAKTEIVESKSGTFNIIVNEIPYLVNKAALLEHIASLVNDKKIDGIKDLRDESNKEGVRIVVELKKDAYPKKVLNQLFKLSQLQDTFHVNMLAVVDGIQPRVLTLKNILEEYVKHRQIVVKRRTEYDLAKARERAHILEGLRIALAKIDEVIATIKKSKDKDEAKVNLVKKFKLTEIQAAAILEMRLQQLANLERMKIEQEYKEKMELIKELESILRSPKKMLDLIKKDVLELKEKYGDERRTKVVKSPLGEFSAEDLIPEEPTVVMITGDGYIKRVPPDTFRLQKRGGKGVTGVTTKEEDRVEHLFSTTTHADLLFFTTRGRAFLLKAYDVPQGSRTAKGQAIVNFLQLAPGEKVSSILPLDHYLFKKKTVDVPVKYLLMVTSQGTIKKTSLEDFKNVRSNGLIAIKLHEGDDLKWVKPTSGEDQISLVTSNGQSIRFSEEDVRPMGRQASGVRGIRLKKNDVVVGMDVIPAGEAKAKKSKLELFTVAENGLGKRTSLDEYKVQNRGGSGIRTMKVTSKTGGVVGAQVSHSDDDRDLILISKKGVVIRVPFKSVPSLGRDTQGVRVMRFREEGDSLSSVAFVGTSEEEVEE